MKENNSPLENTPLIFVVQGEAESFSAKLSKLENAMEQAEKQTAYLKSILAGE